MNESPTVSIVIVCMNNLKNLFPCLDSIKKYTSLSYETLVVAYLFSKYNLRRLRIEYPWVTVIESNEIRGFSENNNLALNEAHGEYCFVLNDDTEMFMPVIDQLVETINNLPKNVAIISPVQIFPDGNVQFCGRPPFDWKTALLSNYWLWSEKCYKGVFANNGGIFESYNIVGSAFLIKTAIFREFGWFDEYYFFCPEDIALSTLLNKNGYKCYVNADVRIVHYEGMSGKSLNILQTAVKPASHHGLVKFYSGGNVYIALILESLMISGIIIRYFFHRISSIFKSKPNREYILALGELNILKSVFTRKTPKQIFLKYYSKLVNYNCNTSIT